MADDNFVVDKTRAEQICDMLIKEDYNRVAKLLLEL